MYITAQKGKIWKGTFDGKNYFPCLKIELKSLVNVHVILCLFLEYLVLISQIVIYQGIKWNGICQIKPFIKYVTIVVIRYEILYMLCHVKLTFWFIDTTVSAKICYWHVYYKQKIERLFKNLCCSNFTAFNLVSKP